MIARLKPLRRGFADYRRLKPPLSEWGLGVTIGIAVKGFFHDFIVTGTDARYSFGRAVQSIDDAAAKYKRLSKNWAFLYSGNDLTRVRALHTRAKSILGAFGEN